jgi:endonuclease-8
VPEGDTVHKVAVVLREGLVGQTPRRVELRPYAADQLPVGLPVTSVEAVGKHCIITFGERVCLRVHLGMYGSWSRLKLPWQRRGEILVVIETANEAFVCHKAKDVELFVASDRPRHPVLSRLGPDLLGPEPDWSFVLARARRSGDRPVADLLADQTVACGFGNVYRNELCFLGEPVAPEFYRPGRGFAPGFPAARLSDETLLGVYQRGREALFANLGGWVRTTVCDARRTPLTPGSPRTWVYGRTGLPCFGCGATILSRGQGEQARATQWCARCQPLDRLGELRSNGRLKILIQKRR